MRKIHKILIMMILAGFQFYNCSNNFSQEYFIDAKVFKQNIVFDLDSIVVLLDKNKVTEYIKSNDFSNKELSSSLIGYLDTVKLDSILPSYSFLKQINESSLSIKNCKEITNSSSVLLNDFLRKGEVVLFSKNDKMFIKSYKVELFRDKFNDVYLNVKTGENYNDIIIRRIIIKHF